MNELSILTDEDDNKASTVVSQASSACFEEGKAIIHDTHVSFHDDQATLKASASRDMEVSASAASSHSFDGTEFEKNVGFSSVAVFPPRTPSMVRLHRTSVTEGQQDVNKGAEEEVASVSRSVKGFSVSSKETKTFGLFRFRCGAIPLPICSSLTKKGWYKMNSLKCDGALASSSSSDVPGKQDTRVESDVARSPADEKDSVFAVGLDGSREGEEKEMAPVMPNIPIKEGWYSASVAELESSSELSCSGVTEKDNRFDPTKKEEYSASVARLDSSSELGCSVVAETDNKFDASLGLRNLPGYQKYLGAVDSTPHISSIYSSPPSPLFLPLIHPSIISYNIKLTYEKSTLTAASPTQQPASVARVDRISSTRATRRQSRFPRGGLWIRSRVGHQVLSSTYEV